MFESRDLRVETKDLPEQPVVSVRKTIPIGEVGRLFGEVARRLRGRPEGAPFAMYHNPDFDPSAVDVEVAFPVQKGGDRVLPAAKVASVMYIGDYGGVGKAYEALFAWMEEQGLKTAGPSREIYLVGPQSSKEPAEYVTEIQIPITPA
ncbi:MAG: GyrI-like domain-containing protein [Firmicutes bacterium]|nr:GyrI-like domain-containing protein [Bacillota bacterium]